MTLRGAQDLGLRILCLGVLLFSATGIGESGIRVAMEVEVPAENLARIVHYFNLPHYFNTPFRVLALEGVPTAYLIAPGQFRDRAPSQLENWDRKIVRAIIALAPGEKG